MENCITSAGARARRCCRREPWEQSSKTIRGFPSGASMQNPYTSTTLGPAFKANMISTSFSDQSGEGGGRLQAREGRGRRSTDNKNRHTNHDGPSFCARLHFFHGHHCATIAIRTNIAKGASSDTNGATTAATARASARDWVRK